MIGLQSNFQIFKTQRLTKMLTEGWTDGHHQSISWNSFAIWPKTYTQRLTKMLTSDGQTRQHYPYARIALQLGQKVVKIEEDHETCSLSEFIQFTVFFAEKSWKKYFVNQRALICRFVEWDMLMTDAFCDNQSPYKVIISMCYTLASTNG